MRAVRLGAAAVLFYLTIAFCARPSLAALANKYAKFSKADRVRDNLRFSNVDDRVQSGKQSKRANAAAAALQMQRSTGSVERLAELLGFILILQKSTNAIHRRLASLK